MFRIRRNVTPATGIALLALFVALSGTSYAVSRLSGSSIKARSIPANRIKKDALGAGEIKESKLGKVPRSAKADSAASAGNASNSDQLGHKAASAYTQGGGQLVSRFYPISKGTSLTKLATIEGAGSVYGGCDAAGTQVILEYINDTGHDVDVAEQTLAPGIQAYNGPRFGPTGHVLYQLSGLSYELHVSDAQGSQRTAQLQVTGDGTGNVCHVYFSGVASLGITFAPPI